MTSAPLDDPSLNDAYALAYKMGLRTLMASDRHNRLRHYCYLHHVHLATGQNPNHPELKNANRLLH